MQVWSSACVGHTTSDQLTIQKTDMSSFQSVRDKTLCCKMEKVQQKQRKIYF